MFQFPYVFRSQHPHWMHPRKTYGRRVGLHFFWRRCRLRPASPPEGDGWVVAARAGIAGGTATVKAMTSRHASKCHRPFISNRSPKISIPARTRENRHV